MELPAANFSMPCPITDNIVWLDILSPFPQVAGMSPQGVRRSGRIAREIAILLMGSDTEGKVFSEETKTVVLSRHGAGIISRHELAAEEEITVRNLESGKAAQARVVGQLGTQSGQHIYGVGFLDDALEFWNMEFPLSANNHTSPAPVSLACAICKEHTTVDLSDLESDVFAVNDGIIRYCAGCGHSTVWRHAAPEPQTAPTEAATPAPAREGLRAFVPESEPAEAPSLYSGKAIEEFSHFSEVTETNPVVVVTAPAIAVATATPQKMVDGANRRKYVRARVTVAACVRSAAFGDDLAICEDISRGGIRFKSRKQYVQGDAIEVAAPFSPETQSIFVTAKIVFVQKIANQDFFRYGVAYLPSSKTQVKVSSQ
jgi:hypothetical protein